MTHLPEYVIRAVLDGRQDRLGAANLIVRLEAEDTAWRPEEFYDVPGPRVIQYVRYRDGEVGSHVLPAHSVGAVLAMVGP